MSLKKLAFIVSSSFLLAACGTVSHPSHYFPEEQHEGHPAKLINFEPQVRTHLLWKLQVAHTTSPKYVHLTPTIGSHLVFVTTSSGEVKAVSLNSGQIVWQKNIGSEITTGVCAKNGRLFVATDNGDVLALNQKTGQVIWKRSSVMSEVLATPVANQNAVFVKSMDGSLIAFSASTGHTIWRYSQSVPSVQMHISSSPALYGHYIAAGFANGHVVLLNNQDGTVIWDKMITRPGSFEGIDVSPVIKNGMVFVGGYRGKILGLNLKNGELFWRHKIAGYRGITADSNDLYITDSKDYVWAFTQDVGALLWRQKFLYYRNISLPGSSKDYVILGDQEGHLHWISKENGKLVARDYLGAPIVIKPVVYQNNVLVYTQSGGLYDFQIGEKIVPKEAVSTH